MASPVVLPAEATARLATEAGLRRDPEVTRLWTGATSTVLVWDDRLTVKVPHHHPTAVTSCLTHARVSPAARQLGVSTPAVLLVSEPDELVPVPVVLSDYVPGEPPARGPSAGPVWSAVGADLALLHAAEASSVPRGLRRFVQHPDLDPAAVATALGQADVLGAAVVREVVAVRDALAPAVLPHETQVFCHGDVHAENVVAADGRYAGLLDLAGAGWLDAAWDFVGMPLPAVRHALTGYHRAGGRVDGLLPRVAWCRLQTAVHWASRTSSPEEATTSALREVTEILHPTCRSEVARERTVSRRSRAAGARPPRATPTSRGRP